MTADTPEDDHEPGEAYAPQPGEDMWGGVDAQPARPTGHASTADSEQQWEQGLNDEKALPSPFIDVAAALAKGIPPPPAPVLLKRADGCALFYAGKVNVLFGDPECGKTWIALAAMVEALEAGRRAAFVDLDHNGWEEIVGHLMLLGATAEQLSDPDLFRLAEPEDGAELIYTVAALKAFRPAVATVDSLGEMLPMLGLSSNSPDDYTAAHRQVLTPLATAGAVVIGIDHLPKSDDARAHGQTGTIAKKRAVNGSTIRVTVHQQFVPGRGGSANLSLEKDRGGGLRGNCPPPDKGKRSQAAGRFVMKPHDDGTLNWWVTNPNNIGESDTGNAETGEPEAPGSELLPRGLVLEALLDRIDADPEVPPNAGRPRLQKWGADNKVKYRSDTWGHIAKARKKRHGIE